MTKFFSGIKKKAKLKHFTASGSEILKHEGKGRRQGKKQPTERQSNKKDDCVVLPIASFSKLTNNTTVRCRPATVKQTFMARQNT